MKNLSLAKQRQLRIVDGGESVHGFGARFAGTGAADGAAVKDEHYAKECVVLRGEEGVIKVAARVGLLIIDGFLGAGEYDGLGAVLNEIGQRTGSVSHGIRAMGDDKAVVAEVVFLHAVGDGQPVFRRHVGGVDIEQLQRIDMAQAGQRRHAGENILGAKLRRKAAVRRAGSDGAAGGDEQNMLHIKNILSAFLLYYQV